MTREDVKNKLISDYFYLMYLDCIKFNNDNKFHTNINNCNFIYNKSNEFKKKKKDDIIKNILYAVAK